MQRAIFVLVLMVLGSVPSMAAEVAPSPSPSISPSVTPSAAPSPSPSVSPSPSPSPSITPPAKTNSETYSYLQVDNEARMRFTDAQDFKLRAALVHSANYAPVRELLTRVYEGVKSRMTNKLSALQSVEWVDNGINKPSQVLLKDLTNSIPSRELYSNFEEGVGIAASIVRIAASPKGDYVAVNIIRSGSIDQSEVKIIRISDAREIATLNLAEPDFDWVSPTQLYYDHLNDDGSDDPYSFDALSGKETLSDIQVMSSIEGLALATTSKGAIYIIDTLQGTSSQIELGTDEGTLIGADSESFYVLLSHGNKASSASQVLKFSRKAPPAPVASGTLGTSGAASAAGDKLTGTTMMSEGKLYVDHAWADGHKIFAQLRAGADRTLSVFSADNSAKLFDIQVPDCCSIKDVSWNEASKTVRLTLTGELISDQIFYFDPSTQTWDRDPNAAMLTVDGVRFVSEVMMSTSQDGTSIPSRVLRRADSKQDSNHTVLLHFYGGFDSIGYIDPKFNAGVREFVKNGGLYVAPALRGGNEYGESWHQAAKKENKIKTYEDLDSAAKELVKRQWTVPSLIAMQGTSNGGLTAAATALLFPADFGLSIPVSGVDDLLGKDELDTTNDGWSYEYGSVKEGASYLSKISPLENASHQGSVHFLIVDGAEDTRVNPAHSVKLAKALMDQGHHPENTYLLTVENAGHWVESVTYQNAVALETEIAIWTMIYDLGKTTPLP